MAVYRLTPIEDGKNCRRWQASSIKPQCLWLQAASEYDARQQVALATAVKSGLLPREGDAATPWNDPALVSCGYDDSKAIPSGIIWVKCGALHSVGTSPDGIGFCA
jgi:hypothetical protein